MEQKGITRPEADGAEGGESEATFSCSLTKFFNHFVGKVCYFVTLNPYKKGKGFKRFQKIGPVSDIIRKYSKYYFLVRERNPDGIAHYHALLVADAKFTLFHKDLKIHISRVGGRPSPPNLPEVGPHCDPPETEEDIVYRHEQWIADELISVGDMACQCRYFDCTVKLLFHIWKCQRRSKRLMKQRAARAEKKLKLTGDIGRIYKYMTKEFDSPELYVDYITCPVHVLTQ